MNKSDVTGREYFDASEPLKGSVRIYHAAEDGKCPNCGAKVYVTSREKWVGEFATPVEKTVEQLKAWGLREFSRKNSIYACFSTPSERYCNACSHTITAEYF